MKRNSQKIIQARSSFGIIDSVSVGIRTVVHIDLAEKNSHFVSIYSRKHWIP